MMMCHCHSLSLTRRFFLLLLTVSHVCIACIEVLFACMCCLHAVYYVPPLTCMHNRICLSVCLSVCLSACVPAVDTEIDTLPHDSFHYLVMIDAGSSGCRAHVFRYGMFSNGQLYILPKHVSFKAKPGLSSFDKTPELAGASLAPLVEFAKGIIPEAEWSLSPIWLKATAGLRLLPQDQSNAILNDVRNFLGDKTKSPFLSRPRWASIIPGHEEGAFGWISVNYLYKIIGPRKVANPEESFAVIEMGGASSQVTQRAPSLEEAGAIPPDYRYTFVLGDGERVTVYTYSYLGMGSEQAREQLNNAFLLKAKVHAEKSKLPLEAVSDPCLNTGFKREKDKDRNNVYEGPNGNFDVVGSAVTGHSCMKVITEVLIDGQKGTSCPHTAKAPFTIGCVHQPDFVKHSKNILVFENFFYTASGAGTLPAGHEDTEESTGIFPLVTSPKEFFDSAQEVCSPTTTDLMKFAPKDMQPKDVSTKLCFSTAYASAFISKALGIGLHKEIMVQKEIDNVDIEWAMGAAYIEAIEFTKKRKQLLRGHVLPFPTIKQ
jgi:Golgi nucleoside diphosphatase